MTEFRALRAQDNDFKTWGHEALKLEGLKMEQMAECWRSP